VDDVQWLDEPTARVLVFLARRAEPRHTVLATLRTSPHDGGRPDPAPARELCPPPARTLPLPPMTAREIADVLDAHGLHGGPSWPRQLVARLHEAASGNPRTALELAAGLHEAAAAGAP
ncbi:helix-turn-helix transcriptional regulator, partial [Streptomyces sp. SID9124]|nr:helix-turn-helix transcriptional regulator [Streptomyces sp. SID9124]